MNWGKDVICVHICMYCSCSLCTREYVEQVCNKRQDSSPFLPRLFTFAWSKAIREKWWAEKKAKNGGKKELSLSSARLWRGKAGATNFVSCWHEKLGCHGTQKMGCSQKHICARWHKPSTTSSQVCFAPGHPGAIIIKSISFLIDFHGEKLLGRWR